jgi:S-formylglutathione hydrolase FrmB
VIRDLSLTSGIIPVAVIVAVVLTIGATVLRRRPGWWKRLLAIVGFGAVVTLVLAEIEWHTSLLPFSFPATFCVWAALIPTTVVLAGVGWPGSAWWRRCTSVLAVLMATVMAAMLVNAHYGYLPTVRALSGEGTAHPIVATTKVKKWWQGPGVAYHPVINPWGRVVPDPLPATVSGFHHRSGYVYLPPIWFRLNHPALPVMVVIGGTPSDPADWLRGANADKTADAYVERHNGWGPIMVFPDANGSYFGDTECVNGTRGAADTYLSVDVPNDVKAKYGASTDPRAWAVVGSSEGGTCALTLALRHPSQFRSFVDLAGDMAPNLGTRHATVLRLFHGSWRRYFTYDPATLLRHHHYAGTDGWFEAGTFDHTGMAAARYLAAASRKAGVDVHLLLRRGAGHNFGFWRAAFGELYPLLSQEIGHVDITS